MGISSTSSLLVDYANKTNVKKESAKTVSWWGKLSRGSIPIRSANVETRVIVPTLVDSCTKVISGPMVTIETEDTYSLTCTLDTLLYGRDGWVRADSIQLGDVIYTNGIPEDNAWRDYDVLKRLYVDERKTMKEVGEILGVSEHTVRKWVGKHDLGTGKGGLFGVENPNYKGKDITRDGGYQRMNKVVDEEGLRTGVCSTCDAVCEVTHMHHIDHNPSNNDPTNLMEICPQCHRIEHVGYTIKHIKRSEVTASYLSGMQDVYEISTKEGVFVSEGFIIKG